jgi:hypothetical protein
MVFHTETCMSIFSFNFKVNLKLFLRLSNCASVGGKERNFDKYQDVRYVRGEKETSRSDSLTRECLVVDLYVCFIHSVLERGIKGYLSYHYTACDNNPILTLSDPTSDLIRQYMIWYDMIYLLTAIGFSPGGSTHLHTNTTYNNTNNNQTTLSAVHAPSLRVLPWHLPYNWGKSMEKPQSGLIKTSVRLRETSVTIQYTYYQKHLHITKPSQTHTWFFQFRSNVRRHPTRFLLRLFTRCRILSDAFPHVVRTLANR